MKKGRKVNTRKQWTGDQDKFLTSLVTSNDVNWPDVASQVNKQFASLGRTGKMCRERWYNYLNPEIKQNKITPSEEVQIFDLYKQYGNKWVEIAKNLPGRTENWVKNLYYATLRRYVRNINKFKTVQKELEWLEGIEVNEKMLAELFLIEHIDFKIFQCIDSPEFKVLSKKVGKSRRRKDGLLVDYLLGRRNCENKRKAKAASKDYEVTGDNIDTLNKIKRVLELLKSTNTIKLCPVRILKEEGKEGQIVCKSRPRRRSTLKKSKLNELKNKQDGVPVRRRSARIQENLIKRNSKEFQYSAFVSAPLQNDRSNQLTAGKFDTSLHPGTLFDIPKQAPVESPLPFKQGIFGDDRREDILTDNECNSLKIPSLVDFNMSNISREKGGIFGEDRLSNSPLSYKKAGFGFADNLTDNEMNEAREMIKSRNPRRKNSITDYMNLKRLSATSFMRHNTRSKNKPQNELGMSRETSNGNRERPSLRMQFGNMKNEDQIKFIRSLSQISNLAHYENDPNRFGMSTMTKTDDKIEDMHEMNNNQALSVAPLEEANLQEFDRIRGIGFPFNDKDFTWINGTINGTRNCSKRNSVISNLSLILNREENKDDN